MGLGYLDRTAPRADRPGNAPPDNSPRERVAGPGATPTDPRLLDSNADLAGRVAARSKHSLPWPRCNERRTEDHSHPEILFYVCHGNPGHTLDTGGSRCHRIRRFAERPTHAAYMSSVIDRRISAQRARAARCGSSRSCLSKMSSRTVPEAANSSTTSASRPHPDSTTEGPARSTSNTATSDGVRDRSSRPTER